MSYPRNNASPERIAIGPVVAIADGAVQTSGVSVSVRGQGGASGAGSGTTAYDNGIVQYTPTQGETDFTSFVVVAYKTGCIPAAVTVVTSAASVPGKVDVGAISGDATAADNLEAVLDGTGGVSLALKQVIIDNTGGTGAALSITSANGLYAIDVQGGGATGAAVRIESAGSNHGVLIQGGPTGNGVHIEAGSTSGDAINLQTTDGHGIGGTIAGTGKHLISTMGTPSDLGGGATVAANLVVIEGQTDDIGAAGAGLTAIPDPLVSTSGTATAGGASTISLQANAVSATDYYKDQAIMLTGGTGAGQTNRIASQAALVATVQTAWATQPDNTTTYKILGRVE